MIYCMSFSSMKEGVEKADICYSLFHLFIVLLEFDAVNFDLFYNATAYFNCFAIIGSGNCKGTLSGCTHFWLAVSFIRNEDNEDLVARKALLSNARLVFL
jgi:hypothetical protein